ALLRTALGSVAREAGDLSAGVYDTQGRMLAQAVTGTPGHVNTMAVAVTHFLERHPLATLVPGDVLVTNDPWMGTGHLFDFVVVTPVFRGARPVAVFASTCHTIEVGARRLLDMLDEFGLQDIAGLAEHILTQSARAAREAIARLPDGEWRAEMRLDGYEQPVTLVATLRKQGEHLVVDYAGSSPA